MSHPGTEGVVVAVVQYCLPDTEELRPFTGGGSFRLFGQAAHMVDREDGGCHKPGRTQDRTHCHLHSYHEQVQVIAAPFLQTKHPG